MRSLFDDLGSASHNLSQKLKGKMDSSQTIEINGINLVMGDTISEGGYGFIIRCMEQGTGKKYVLKKSICNNEQRSLVAQAECQFLASVSDTSHIVKCYGVKRVKQDNSDVFYCLLEYMPEGSLFEFMERKQNERFSEKACLKIFRQVCAGIHLMHHMNPPRQHRDLKIENILFDGENFKLCDFGSVTTDIVDFKQLSKNDYDSKIHDFDKKTTITYRPPEMCDPYLQLKVDTKADIWMLGCILFALAFYKHPFQECTTLSIVNASYYVPNNHQFSEKFVNLIRNLLTPDPALRYDIDQVVEILDSWDTVEIKLNKQAEAVRKEHLKRQNLWNEDAWANIGGGKKDIDFGSLSAQLKNTSPDHSKASIQEHQVRAEFSDFNVDGLKKFQSSKKYVNPNPYGKAQPGFDFNAPQQSTSTTNMADFLTWDMSEASNQTNPSQSTPTQDFTEFKFEGSQAQEPLTPFDNDPFTQASTQVHASTSGSNFWDAFGGSEHPHVQAHTHGHSLTGQPQHEHRPTDQSSFDPFSQPGPGDRSSKSAIDQLMEMSIEPVEASLQSQGKIEAGLAHQNSDKVSQESLTTKEGQQQMETHQKPGAGQQGVNSFLDMDLS